MIKVSKNNSRLRSIEQMLEEEFEKYKTESESINALLERNRSGETEGPLQFALNKGHKNIEPNLPESKLEDNKAKVGVSYRNAEAHQGDVPVLERQRLTGKKSPVMESEKYKKATD